MLKKVQSRLNQYTLEIIVFAVGAIVMILELVGSRILAPYLGTSIFVWTSIIGIILGSLSLGYWQGGKMADKNPSYKTFSLILLLAAIFIGLNVFLKSLLLAILYGYKGDIRIEAIIASLILFAPASFLLGIISPYAVKLKIQNLDKSGSTVGNLYAISTIGSITGTFLAGFFLISYFTNTELLLILSSSLIICSLVSYGKYSNKIKIGLILFLIFSFSATNYTEKYYLKHGLIDIDTAYNKVWISSVTDPETGKEVKLMMLNNEGNSAMYAENDNENLVFKYAAYYRLASHFKPDFKNSLLLGGGAYSWSKYYLKNYPEARIDVVEIDPKLTEISRQYFRLKNNSRLTIYHEDARIFLNETSNKYDVVFGDAFKSMYSVPYQLTTREATEKIFNSLNSDGVAIINIIGSIEGKNSKFIKTEYKTYQSIFPQVYLFPVENHTEGKSTQNIILIALKSDQKPSFRDINPEMDRLLQHVWTKEISTDLPILTDDYAPVDQYMMSII